MLKASKLWLHASSSSTLEHLPLGRSAVRPFLSLGVRTTRFPLIGELFLSMTGSDPTKGPRYRALKHQRSSGTYTCMHSLLDSVFLIAMYNHYTYLRIESATRAKSQWPHYELRLDYAVSRFPPWVHGGIARHAAMPTSQCAVTGMECMNKYLRAACKQTGGSKTAVLGTGAGRRHWPIQHVSLNRDWHGERKKL